MKASLKNYKQSPRKVRLVADLIRSKSVNVAMEQLQFLPKRAAKVFQKLLSSAVANAENNNKKDIKNLSVGRVTVDEGKTLKRWRARARGRAGKINKRTSNINILLSE